MSHGDESMSLTELRDELRQLSEDGASPPHDDSAELEALAQTLSLLRDSTPFDKKQTWIEIQQRLRELP